MQLADLPTDGDRDLFTANLQALRQGRAELVVTGQQPGAMGGPLYTLYKIAATVALARLRTASGRPTVPVFWSGDDDDDLQEAVAARSYDPARGRLVADPGGHDRLVNSGQRRPCVGNLRAARWSARTLAWLQSPGVRDRQSPLGARVGGIWAQACRENWTWDRLNRRFLLEVFSGTGLMVVSGNDPWLHRRAAPLYRRILDLRADLALAVREEGRRLAAAGHGVPVSDRSAHRHLFLVDGEGRRFLPPGEEPGDPGQLRPSVVLRSPVQDWLLEPAAVIVGPGELAYLRQLGPVYRALGVPRRPLVPRLFGWLVPRGFPGSQLADFNRDFAGQEERAARLARQAGDRVQQDVAATLIRQWGVPAARAERLAAGRSRRWQRSVADLFRSEARRAAQEALAAQPAWVFPEGKRQERVLSSLAAVLFWGDDHVESILTAAAEHLAQGARGRWREMVAEVPDPAGEQP
jgi:uncharacterized protein YllA (UPF0747 family)